MRAGSQGTSRLFALIAVVLGLLPPLLIASNSFQISRGWLLVLNLFAWASVAGFYLVVGRLTSEIDATLTDLGIQPQKIPFARKLGRLLSEFSRQHRAAFRFSGAEATTDRSALGANLRSIAELGYAELGAQAIELSLFDEASAQSSQSIVLGEPRTIASQSMLSEAAGAAEISGDPHVIVEQLKFAGTVFGNLRVELPKDRLPDESDFRVLKLLGLQATMMLINSRFSEELLRMRRLGDESVRAKTGFLANLSHEIRGPLGIILNAVELSLDGLAGPVSQQLAEMLKMIQSNGEHLLDLVNDVLDYARVESGNVSANPESIPVRNLLKDLASVVRSQADAKKHKLVVTDCPGDWAVRSDKRHLRQMMINLLTNAVKYTPEGGLIELSAEKATRGRVLLKVKDSGVGIPASERDKVFAAFQRVEHEYSQKQVGTGLGMPLTKRLAQLNGGDVDFDSELGRGSTFMLLLPPGQIGADTTENAESQRPIAGPQGRGERLLIVDATSDTREMLSQYLTHQGFNVLSARTVEDSVPLLRKNEFDLALIDADSPDTAAEEVIGVFKSSPQFAAVPILLLSGRAFVFDIERFLKLGVERCISKPAELSDISTAVREVLDSTRATKP